MNVPVKIEVLSYLVLTMNIANLIRRLPNVSREFARKVPLTLTVSVEMINSLVTTAGPSMAKLINAKITRLVLRKNLPRMLLKEKDRGREKERVVAVAVGDRQA